MVRLAPGLHIAVSTEVSEFHDRAFTVCGQLHLLGMNYRKTPKITEFSHLKQFQT